MLENCDKIITPISSTTNQWPHEKQLVLDDRKSFMASSSSTNKAEKPNKDQDQDHIPHPLKCPRCDSSNTKFCYYNNYSLSQPRHFCKACKRYWTRGGTLRNVPVGGGCRKNKRPKRHSSSAPTATANPSAQPHRNPSSHIQNPLLYGLPTNPLELNFPFSNFRVSSDLHPQINGLGLGFSSGLIMTGTEASNNGFKPIQDAITNPTSSPFSSSLFFQPSSSSSFSTYSTMASLLASTLQQQEQRSITIPSQMPQEDPQMPGNCIGKHVKAEGENKFNWNPNPNPNTMDEINSSDPSSLVWNASSIGAWFDPSTMGSSVPSLI